MTFQTLALIESQKGEFLEIASRQGLQAGIRNRKKGRG
jgi:ribosome modulation factor